MKKLIYVVAIALTFTACDNRQAEIDQANRQKDSLASIINERDSSLNDFLTSFNDIEKNLDSIARKQNAINVNVESQGELKKSSKDRIFTIDRNCIDRCIVDTSKFPIVKI